MTQSSGGQLPEGYTITTDGLVAFPVFNALRTDHDTLKARVATLEAGGGGGGGSGVTTFVALTDTPSTIQAGRFLRANVGGTAIEFADLPAGVVTFLGLNDTPGSFAGQALRNVRVNASATALEFFDPPSYAVVVRQAGGPDVTATTRLTFLGADVADLGGGEASVEFNALKGTGWHFWNTTNGTPFSNRSGGVGASVGSPAPTDVTSLGEAKLEVGTDTNGHAAITTAQGPMRLGHGFELIITFRVNIPTLSDGTNTYILRSGFVNGWTSGSPNGAYFEYDSAVSLNWRLINNNAGTQTVTTTGVAVTTGWHTLQVRIPAAGTSAEYRRNGVLLGTVAGGLPTGTFGFGVTMNKTAGTTSRSVAVDWGKIYVGGQSG